MAFTAHEFQDSKRMAEVTALHNPVHARCRMQNRVGRIARGVSLPTRAMDFSMTQMNLSGSFSFQQFSKGPLQSVDLPVYAV